MLFSDKYPSRYDRIEIRASLTEAEFKLLWIALLDKKDRLAPWKGKEEELEDLESLSQKLFGKVVAD